MEESFIQTGTVTTRKSGSQPKQLSNLMLYRIAKGRTRWTVDGTSLLLREGNVLVLLPGQVFSGVESSESVMLEVEYLEIRLCAGSKRLTGSALARALGCSPADAREIVSLLRSLDHRVFQPDESLSRLFREFAAEQDHSSSLYRRISTLHLLAGLACSTPRDLSTTASTRSRAESDVALFLSELEARCEEPWTLESMAEGANLKRSRFGTLCRKLTGESPAVYLNRLRIRKSRKLLGNTDLSVTDIAFECGFSSSQYFAKTFRRFQGHEPTHYRRLAQEMTLSRGAQYLKGEAERNAAYAATTIGAGDFKVTGEIMLDRLGDTAASLEFGSDRFGFDGREGCFFLEGATFGEARFFDRSGDVIHEGEFFDFILQRQKNMLSMDVNGRRIFSITDPTKRTVGKVGLRPLRNGIHVRRFEINNERAALKISGS